MSTRGESHPPPPIPSTNGPRRTGSKSATPSVILSHPCILMNSGEEKRRTNALGTSDRCSLPARSLEVRRRQGLCAAGDQGGVPELQQDEPDSGAQERGDRGEAASVGGVLLHQRDGRGVRGGGEADRGGDVGAALASRPRPGSLPRGVLRRPGDRTNKRRFGDGEDPEEWRCRCSAGSGDGTVTESDCVR
ncbi:hypothetical protein GW17_00028723 [Ensete ventricosum]|nr:hypothetical protein GW17_00028723 [Ensete ventricosum]